MTEEHVPTYWDYLELERLLDLQGGLEGDESSLLPDELHFIVVHQAYELWFKLVLRELRLGRDHLSEPRVPEERVPFVVHHLRRVTTILGLLVEQFEVMETLTPQDFLAFRDKLMPASGFQSFQLREIEIVLGLDESARVHFAGGDPISHIETLAADSPGGSLARSRIEAARGETSLRAALGAWLHRTPIQGSSTGDPADDEVVAGFIEDYLDAQAELRRDQEAGMRRVLGVAPDELARGLDAAADRARAFLHAEDVPAEERARTRRIRAALVFIESYRELPLLAWPRLLIDTIVDLEEKLVLFRSRHARMVERVIGRRMGTGGSSGVDYLDETTRLRIFGELWAVRTLLLPRDAVPPVQHAERYGFAGGADGV
jgi:tryptophan 2,3-dioxygenase